MNKTKSSQLTVAAAYGAAVLFAIHLVTYLIPSIRDVTTTSSPIAAELLVLLGVAEHLLLFPVIAALPAPQWAKSAGYGWLVIDMATEIMQLNGVAKLIYLSLRYGGHISAAIWIASASWRARGALRIIGWLTALDLFIYSFIAFIPFSFVILLPSLILLPAWIALVGRLLARTGVYQPGQTEVVEEQVTV
ncbi:MAG: hypothetical protein ACJ788_03970 [Ktedonobacteraceae bacterium]